MSSINSLLFGIVLTTASINALSGGFNVNPTTATTNTTTPSWAGLIASGPSANASSVYAFPAAALASGPSNATTFVFSGANAGGSNLSSVAFQFMGVTAGANNASLFIYTPASSGGSTVTNPQLTGIKAGPFNSTAFSYLGTMSAGASTANATIYQFLGIQSGPNNQTIYSVVYVSSGPMNFTGNNFVFTTITSGAGNTSIVYSGATAGAGNTTLIGSGVVASGPQNWTIPVNPMNGGPYNSVFSQLPIAYKTGASMQGLINTHIIFYGAASRNYFTSANKAIVQNFLANVYGTSWYAVAMKYGVGRVILGQSVFVDCQSSSGYGCAITTANVQALVWSQIGSPLPADSSAFYLVVTAPEVIEAQDPTSSTSPSLGQSYCGYHNFIYSNVFDTFKYAVVGVPNISPISMTGIVTAGSIPSMTKPASKCIYAINPSSASPNGDAQVDMAITTIAHELIEAIISPVAIQTWSDANNLEAMDKCGTFVSGLTKTTTSNGQAALYNVQVLNGYNYVLPMIWDPQSQSCSLGSIFVSEWTAVGCYTDNPDPRRILSHQVLVSSLSSMTIELCQTACMNAGYIYAGVESGSECRCDNVFAPSQEASTVCTTPCTGNSAELCGGSYAINVYKLPYISTPQSTLLGCYVDSASPNRVLGNKLTLASTAMTIETCQAACFNAGYKYAGLEGIPSIQECWCDNTLPTSTTTSTGCTIPCNGNSAELCGGNWAISVYLLPPNKQVASTMLGCYADSASAHTLTSFSSTSNAQTVEMCKFTCSNYLFYGLSGNTCYCGNTISNGGTLQPSAGSCNINCAGNTAQICGGSSSISLYGPSSTWNYAGCYGDASSTRPLAAVWVNSAYSGMTVENCQSYCGANNYTFAGLEYGMECYCGNTISSSSPQLPAASCQTKMRCTGSAAESCGAGNMMDIYTSKKNYVASALPTSKTWTPYGSGCYTDSNNLRSITNGVRLINDLNNSPSLCQTQCGSLGYKYAGLEYSQECWCSNSLNSIISRMSATAGSCSMPCTGSSSTCGGVGYMQLYQS